MSWKDRAKKVDDTSKSGTWKERAEKVEPELSALESGFRGGIKGLSFGFDEEGGGMLEALGSKIGLRGLGSPSLSDVRLESDEEDKQAFWDVYREARDKRKALNQEAQEDNPTAYMGGLAGGAVVSSIAAPVGNIAKGGSLASRAASAGKIGAVEGALYGAGESEADLTKGEIGEFIKDTVMGGGIGAGAGLGGEVVATGASKGYRAVKNLLSEAKPTESTAKVVSNLAFDLPEQYTDAILKNPGRFKDAKSMLALQDEAVDAVNTLRRELASADTKAWDTLGTKVVATADDFDSLIETTLLKNKVIRKDANNQFVASNFKQDVQALKKVQEIQSELKSINNLSERDLKSLIQKIDNETDWDKPDLETANQVLQNIRTQIDMVLKGRNQAYAKAMEEVAPKAELMSNLVKELRLAKGKYGFEATDTTLSKLKNLKEASGNVKKPKSESNFKELSKYRSGNEPLDFVEDINLSRIDSVTNTGVANGARSTLAGAVLGGGIGYANNQSPEGVLAGAALGFAKDKYGRKIGKALLEKGASSIKATDSLINKLGSKLPNMPEKYQRAFETAQRRGASSVAVTHFLLQQQDPEYRKLMNEDDNQ